LGHLTRKNPSPYDLYCVGVTLSLTQSINYSVTMMLNELALPRFDEIAEKYRCDFRQQMSRSNNGLVSLFSRLSVW